jgi:hypothetical protein
MQTWQQTIENRSVAVVGPAASMRGRALA